MGTGLMTFDTVPGWGLTAEDKSAIGPTHGGVVIGRDGTIYISADKGVIAFSPDGRVVREFLGEPYTKLHDIEIRDEEGTEYLYGARNANAEGIKFNARDGKIALKLTVNEVIGGLGMPTSVAVQGDYVSVPDLHGRVVILDKSNTIMAVLGHNPDPKQGRNYGVKQADWIEGVFSGTHGSGWDADGNLYVQDWNVDGRIMKLVRVKG